MNTEVQKKKCLLMHSKDVFIDDILNVLEKVFTVNIINECNGESFKVKQCIKDSNLCLIVATFDKNVLHSDMGKICLHPGMSLDIVFFMGLVTGTIDPHSMSTKVLVYNRDKIVEPGVMCAIPQVASLSSLEDFLQMQYHLQ
ncbi:hypothetical protein CAXC1_90010 [Candidatus Xenohaliotis californiensis]|uniref:Uncharacterized protein n=1 Tax=Candidatus Xenohaliotis californiensis TaxID=84677 RepID=A0ABM9N9H3_9RICK|nr:hypothetical protein CAXC1_90010 [Candidatus Xenohaliotis californiensis]